MKPAQKEKLASVLPRLREALAALEADERAFDAKVAEIDHTEYTRDRYRDAPRNEEQSAQVPELEARLHTLNRQLGQLKPKITSATARYMPLMDEAIDLIHALFAGAMEMAIEKKASQMGSLSTDAQTCRQLIVGTAIFQQYRRRIDFPVVLNCEGGYHRVNAIRQAIALLEEIEERHQAGTLAEVF